MIGNLMQAAWTKEGATIGGGIFTPEECLAAARKLAAAEATLSALEVAVAEWAEQFDGDPDTGIDINGADFLDWFIGWRLLAKGAIAKATTK